MLSHLHAEVNVCISASLFIYFIFYEETIAEDMLIYKNQAKMLIILIQKNICLFKFDWCT